jgi:hypothetical protein
MCTPFTWKYIYNNIAHLLISNAASEIYFFHILFIENPFQQLEIAKLRIMGYLVNELKWMWKEVVVAHRTFLESVQKQETLKSEKLVSEKRYDPRTFRMQS